LQTTAAALQVRRRPAPAGQALRGPATTCQPLRLRLAYLRSRLSALLVATPWVNPCAVAVTNEQCRAWAGCGARLKAAIVLTAIAATSNLLMVLPSLHGHGFSHRLQHTILTRFIDPSSLGRWLWLSQVKSVPAKSNLARAHALAHPFYDRATQRVSRGLFADLYPGILLGGRVGSNP
jgi:hypothetical protein